MIGSAGCAGSAKKDNQSTPAQATSTLGQTGGVIELPNSAKLQVGAGALSANVDITLAVAQPPVAPPGSAASDVVEFTPHGTLFAYPARISLKYSGADQPLVMRLADPSATEWTPVGGVTYADGEATFDTLQFSYYVVVSGVSCQSTGSSNACSTSCNCCGSSVCVNTTNDPHNCGACGNACGTLNFCSSSAVCSNVNLNHLCDNSALTTIQGALPSLSVVNPQQTEDSSIEQTLTSAITAQCHNSGTLTSQATPGLLDACSDMPLLAGGNTVLVVGGDWSQRLARYANKAIAPVMRAYDSTRGSNEFISRAGTVITTFPDSKLTQSHDYFVISVEQEPVHGSLVVQVYGIGWQGTPAASWYFQHVVLQQVQSKTVPWNSYIVVEWTDNGDGVINAQDTFKVLAQDVP